MTASREAVAAPPAAERRRVTVRGVVQGVGFRPFVFTLAAELGLTGQVGNTGDGVVAEVEGAPRAVAAFCRRIGTDAPPLAVVESVAHHPLPPGGSTGFRIAATRTGDRARTLIAPDTATCAACLAELTDPGDRRHRHPFLTCTHCGPRFTIVTALPYDRAATTMAAFPMCARCAREYADPADRRFHAQPIACHDCGPRMALRRHPGTTGAAPADPVAAARRMLADGAILAVKGLGGYHLACDATRERSVRLLRERKARGGKPFAVMARDLAAVEGLVHLSAAERDLLTGGRRPIVLLRRRDAADRPPHAPAVADAVAPGSPDLGVMLPYTPLHHLLFGLPGDPPGPGLLVMTSGNRGGEPIVTDDADAFATLAPLVDGWLTHDRPIHVPCDDSVVRMIDGAPVLLRRSRGYAPDPLPLPVPVTPALAVGGDLKNVLCLGEGRRAWLSAHIGDMDDLATVTAFDRAAGRLADLTGVRPRRVVADRHPGYRSLGRARRAAGGDDVRRVQHHHAHIASAMAEHGLDGSRKVIGVAFDGTGYGDDGAVWGGEFLLADYDGFHRFAHLAYVPQPGGDAAVRHPYRMALAHLHAAGLPRDPDLPCVRACPPGQLPLLERQLARGVNCAPTSSMGRLFDAVASLTGVCHTAGYEAQAAVTLEAAACRAEDRTPHEPPPGYTFTLRDTVAGPVAADPAPLLAALAAEVRAGVPAGRIAAHFHHAVAALVGRVCAAARDRHGLDTVALTGGVFANRLLSASCARALRADGFTVLRHRLVPPGDGGLALGQLMVAARADPRGATTAP
ncbi:carbamoyltransferase HypF [Streptomyces sp. NBC_01525]|uniref:carbamoyltransferase HypF n=1 Tax=Streptomyces sp. NBC_01525 TaxID=2903893 RepID=UPI00386461D9